MFPDFFTKIGNIPGDYPITLDPNIPPVQHRRCRLLIEAKEDIKIQLREMIVQVIITPQVEPTPRVSSLAYPCKTEGALRVCLNPKVLNNVMMHIAQKNLYISQRWLTVWNIQSDRPRTQELHSHCSQRCKV